MSMSSKKFILVDTTYINSGGGKVLLDILVKALWEKKTNVFYLFDSRNNIEQITDYIENYRIINPSEAERKKNYKNLIDRVESILCFGNIPPPITVNIKVSIYFHNELLLNPLRSSVGFAEKIKLILKKYYLLINNDKNYYWICQTENIAVKLQKFFNISKEKIQIFPFYDSKKTELVEKVSNTFIYPANFSKHKNHYRLFKAFTIAAKNINKKITLYLTLDVELFKNSFYSNNEIPRNLNFVNIGLVPHGELIDYISRSEFLIFPSLNESFGLPLIEAAINNCYIVASNKDFVYEVVSPTLKFDPTSISDISKSIKNAYRKKGLINSKLLVENKIDTFVEYIKYYV